MRALGKLHGIEFLARPNVEKVIRFSSGEAFRKFARLDLHRAIGGVARKNACGDFIDIEIFVPGANAAERFVRAEPATRAAADMIAGERVLVAPQGSARAASSW